MAKESPLVWNYIKPKLEFDWVQRIESPITPGFPDVHIIHDSQTIYLELKYCDRVTEHLGLRQEQRVWHTKANRMLARSFLLARLNKALYIVPGCDLWNPFEDEESLRLRSIYESEVGNFDSPGFHNCLINWGRKK